MSQTWQKIKSNQYKIHFIIYSLTFIFQGSISTIPGPLIPYLAEQQKISQSQYSFLFLCRAIGYFTMSFGIKKIQKCLNLHQILFFGSILSTFSWCMFSFFSINNDQDGNFIYLGGFMIIGAWSMCVSHICIKVAVLELYKNNNLDFWMQLIFATSGLGGLLGPILVYFFQTKAFFVVGLMMACMTPFYFHLKSPEVLSEELQIKENQQGLVSKSKKLPEVSQLILKLLSLSFFLYIGCLVSYGGWISTYAVMHGVSTKEEATKYPSYFWISGTFFRFFIAGIAGKISQKTKKCFYGAIISLIISIILILLKEYLLSILISSWIFGATLSLIYPYLITLPSQFGNQLTVRQSSTIYIFGSIGQAFLAMIIGFLMTQVAPDMLFYCSFIFMLCFYWLFLKMMQAFKQNQILQQEKQSKKKQII